MARAGGWPTSALHAAPCRHTRRAVCECRPLVLFSTNTGDAWLLDPSERLATRLARDGEPEPVHIEESDTNFAVARTGHYRIKGAAFIYGDHASGRVTTILGYPGGPDCRTWLISRIRIASRGATRMRP